MNKPGEDAGGKAARVAWRTLVAGLAVFPKVGGFGTGYLNSLGNNLRYADQGWRPVLVKVGKDAKKIPVPYTYMDAARDAFLAGPGRGAQITGPMVERALAGQQDAKARSLFLERPKPVEWRQAPATVQLIFPFET